MRTIRIFNTPFRFSRLSTFYLMLFVALAAAAGVVIYSSRTSISKYNSISTTAVSHLNVLQGIRQEADAMQLATLRMVFNTERGDVEREQMNIREMRKHFQENWAAFQHGLGQSPSSATRTFVDWRYRDSVARQHLIGLSDKGAVFNDSAIRFYYTVQQPIYEQYQQSIETLNLEANHNIHAELAGTDQFVSSSSTLINCLLMASFAIMLLGGRLLIHHHKKLSRIQAQLAHERQERHVEITRQTLNAQEQERAELSRELHDNVNQLLSATRLTLSVASENPEQREILIPRSIDSLSQAIEEIRCLCKALVNPVFRHISLQAALEELISNIRNASPSVSWTLNVRIASEECLPKDVKLAAYRVVQEQLANILKHANASNAHIEVHLKTGTLLVQVSDDGRGFEPSSEARGIGLHNIANRVAAYRGSADLVTAPGGGCRWTVKFPLQPLRIRTKIPPILSRVALWCL